MSTSEFDELLHFIEPKLIKADTNFILKNLCLTPYRTGQSLYPSSSWSAKMLRLFHFLRKKKKYNYLTKQILNTNQQREKNIINALKKTSRMSASN